jgi:signal transduction histidine kinase
MSSDRLTLLHRSWHGLPAIDQRVCMEQLRELWQMGLWSVPGQLAGLIVTLKVIAQSSLSWHEWSGPVGLLLATWLVSGAWLVRFRQRGIHEHNYQRWRHRTLLREATQSIGWGWLGAVLWAGLTPQWHMLLLVGIVVFCFTSLLFCMKDFGVAVLASSPVMLIMVARLSVSDEAASPYVVLILLAAYITYLGIGQALAQRLFEGARLRHFNAELAAQLATEVKSVQAARQRAEQASRDKSAFLTAASHDLRQPLHSLTLLAGMLEHATDFDTVRHTSVRMQAAMEGLRSVFDQLFDLALLDAGKQPHRPQHWAVDTILGTLHDEYAAAFEAKGLNWRLDTRPVWVEADPLFVQRIVRNLLDNALKYTQQGQVRLRVCLRGARVHLQVWDTGQGIPPALHQRVFDDFVQGHNAERRRSEGLGLGLAVVRRLAEQGGYAIRLLSREGRGSCFSLSLPLGTAPIPNPVLLGALGPAGDGRTEAVSYDGFQHQPRCNPST